MSNWMNYRPSSTLRFWSYRQMIRHTRNPPISIRLAEKSKFRKWNVHNVMRHNGSDDQNIAGKYIQFIIRGSTNRFLKSLKFSRSNDDRKEVEFWPLTRRDHWFVSIHLKRGCLTCFKQEYPLENNSHDTQIQSLDQIRRLDQYFNGYF